MINSYFDHIYVLNLQRRTDRKKNIQQKLDFKYEFFEAVDAKDVKNNLTPEQACVRSHLNILQNAIECRYRNYLVLEDDVLIHYHIDQFPFSKLPPWDLLYLGANQHPTTWNKLNRNKYVYPVHDYMDLQMTFFNCSPGNAIGYTAYRTRGTFAYAVNSSIYESLRSKIIQSKALDLPIDSILGYLQEHHKSYVIQPNLFICDVSNSDIHEMRDQKQFARTQKWDLSIYL